MEIDLKSSSRANTLTRQQGLANEYVLPSAAIGGYSGLAPMPGLREQGRQVDDLFPMHGLADYWIYPSERQGRDIWIGTGPA